MSINPKIPILVKKPNLHFLLNIINNNTESIIKDNELKLKGNMQGHMRHSTQAWNQNNFKLWLNQSVSPLAKTRVNRFQEKSFLYCSASSAISSRLLSFLSLSKSSLCFSSFSFTSSCRIQKHVYLIITSPKASIILSMVKKILIFLVLQLHKSHHYSQSRHLYAGRCECAREEQSVQPVDHPKLTKQPENRGKISGQKDGGTTSIIIFINILQSNEMQNDRRQINSKHVRQQN